MTSAYMRTRKPRKTVVEREENNTPPTRLCECQHVYANHRGRCRVVQGCDCPGFVEDRIVPRLVPDSHWLAQIRLDPHIHHSRNPR